MLIPPIKFALVVGEVYRSGHPISYNYPFLESLNLKTILHLGVEAPEAIANEYRQWAKQQGIRLLELPLKSVKEPFVEMDPSVVERAMQLIADKQNHPILVHSDKGQHRVGVVVACIRKCYQQWSLAAIYDEYIRFAKGKADADFLFIELFQPSKVLLRDVPRWVVPTLSEHERQENNRQKP